MTIYTGFITGLERLTMRLAPSVTSLILAAGLVACGAQSPASNSSESQTSTAELVADIDAEKEAETERLNAWFETKFNEAVSRSPMSATFLGSRENYDKWDDVSQEARDAEMEVLRANVAEMRDAFDPAKLTDQGKLSFRLAEYDLERDEIANNWRGYNYTFSQMRGAHASIASFMIGQHKVTSKSDAEAYISRLGGISTYLGQHLANAQASAERGIRPPLFVYDFVIEGAGNVINGYPFEGVGPAEPSPLYADFIGKVDALVSNGTITQDEADELDFEARGALLDHVYPTYFELIQWVSEDKANATADDGAWKHENGAIYYNDRLSLMTTTDMTSDEIHDLGLAGVGSLLRPLEVSLALGELLGDLLVLGVRVLGLGARLLEVLLQGLHPLLVLLALVGQHLAHALRVVTGGGRLVQLARRHDQLLLVLLQVLLQRLDPPVEGVDLGLGSHEGLLLLLELHGDDGEPLGGDVELSLQLPRLVEQLRHLVLGLLGAHLGLLGALLASVRPVHGVVLLDLHGLHLLLDGLHFGSLLPPFKKLLR